jgi:AGCS family alanine or glycine:cation symporter
MATMMQGVRRGLFSNEAGQGSAPIAHAAAQTDEPAAEGFVALIGPFIDTLVICTMTGLVLITTGVWNDRVPSTLELAGGDSAYALTSADGVLASVAAPERIEVKDGRIDPGEVCFVWHETPVERLYTDAEQLRPFVGTLFPREGRAIASDGRELTRLYGLAAESGAPMTRLAFERELGPWGGYLVVMSVFLFGLSTAISWSYYGDRSVKYLFGDRAILPFKVIFVGTHFAGAIFAMTTVWMIGDIFTGLVIFPNLIALVLLSPTLVKVTRDYLERRPWLEKPTGGRESLH